MRIGVFHNKPYYLRYYLSALEALRDRGHELVLLGPDRYESVRVPKTLRDRPGVSSALYPWRRSDGLDEAVSLLRVARDSARYLAPAFHGVAASKKLAFTRLARALSVDPDSVNAYAHSPVLERISEGSHLNEVFAELERLIPPDEGLRSFIEGLELDLVVSINRVNVGGPQMEPVKCAAALGLPVAVVVYSWDNLTAGGMLHVHPDRLFVWNETQVREAVELHGFPAERTIVTGAPRFDSMFERRPSAPRAKAALELGLDPARATVLWLGSSKFVAPQEPRLVEGWVAALRTSSDPRLQTADILVRPHPQAVETPLWAEWRPPEGVTVPPRVVRDRAQDLFDQLWVSDAVIALNTTASIEAALLGKPVLTIKAGAGAPGQEGQLNVAYLLEENGGFVQAAAGLDEHVAQLSEALASDPLAHRRSAFLESFLRPRGIDRPAGGILADELERLLSERGASPTEAGPVAAR